VIAAGFRSRWHAGRRWIIEHVPLPFLTNAHEMALAAVLSVVGAALLVQEARPESVVSQVPFWTVTVWASLLIAGGVCTLAGISMERLRTEWVGQVCTGWGCWFYSAAVFTKLELKDSIVVGSVFFVLGMVSHWRAFKIIMAPYVQTRLARHRTFAALQAQRRLVRDGGHFDGV